MIQVHRCMNKVPVEFALVQGRGKSSQMGHQQECLHKLLFPTFVRQIQSIANIEEKNLKFNSTIIIISHQMIFLQIGSGTWIQSILSRDFKQIERGIKNPFNCFFKKLFKNSILINASFIKALNINETNTDNSLKRSRWKCCQITITVFNNPIAMYSYECGATGIGRICYEKGEKTLNLSKVLSTWVRLLNIALLF